MRTTCRFTALGALDQYFNFFWQFGDGAFATALNPTHTYAVPTSTTFPVTLSYLDPDLGGGTVSHQVTVAPE